LEPVNPPTPSDDPTLEEREHQQRPLAAVRQRDSGQRKSFHEPMTVNSEYRPRHGQHDTTQQHQRAGTGAS
jgi:hypothetical protein